MRDACCASLSRDSLGRYVENLNSGAEENFNHTTHLFGQLEVEGKFQKNS